MKVFTHLIMLKVLIMLRVGGGDHLE